MNKKNKTVIPKLRLCQFKDKPEWDICKFGRLIVPVEERAGSNKYTLMSVTSGVGLVSQVEKFGREIAGSAYKNYYVIKKNDFAYNKSATKLFPEGYISMLTEYEEAALPNSIFTCFRIVDKECDPRFFDQLFHNNYHGTWLRKYIEVGARSHGSLSVDTKHLWNMPVALPKLEEQQKIADCLSSLDDLIAAEDKKLSALKDHKKGLMQKLFPSEGKTVPEWRFPEFKDCGKWESRSLSMICDMQAGKFVQATQIFEKQKCNMYPCYGGNGLRGYTYSFTHSGEYSLIGRQGALCGNVTHSTGDFHATEHAVVATEKHNVCAKWLYFLLIKMNLNQYATGQAQPGLSVQALEKIGTYVPKLIAEQQKIADCLTSVDELITSQTEKIEALKEHKKA
ncbi:restriction endonuclease subunit S [Anaerovorax sp. IOR16]|uniref:restriction endonuclease subunit S n=1 Tax=Anaerovorax sp. IOR16 TaxID=2773458 RepID=UPI0019D2AA34|nr:restriction endonuclease subunit S [Anaerovorax sp. IOR16]